MASPTRPTILLFRRDLRLDDNPALIAALAASPGALVPAYVWAPEEEGQFAPGRHARWWTQQCLALLQQQLGSLGSRLVLRRAAPGEGGSAQAVLQLVADVGAGAVFFSHAYDPISLVRDHALKQRLTEAGVACRSFNSETLWEPWAVLDEQGQPYTTFESFLARLRAMPDPPPFPHAPPALLPPVALDLASLPLEALGIFDSPEAEASSNQVLASKWQPGSAGGLAQLDDWVSSQLAHFSSHKAKVDASVTSRLSPWLASGSLSVRFLWFKVKAREADAPASCQQFLRQLALREYSRHLSFHFPFLSEAPLLAHLRCVPWQLDQRAFKAWKLGMTGYPIVDAGMKALWSTGWLHNRLRVVCGTFAVKYLLLPWQWGLKHLWDTQVDADLLTDVLGWQYVAGCMSDSPPFGQWMDVVAEGAGLDPQGEYVRQWLPVLARLPAAYVHAPWTAPPEVLAAADVELGYNYPAPIVTQDEAAARLAAAAAVIEASLREAEPQEQAGPSAGEEPPLQQQQLQDARPASSGRLPYRPATQPSPSQARAFAAAADLAATSSVAQLPQAPGGPRGASGALPPLLAAVLARPPQAQPGAEAGAEGADDEQLQAVPEVGALPGGQAQAADVHLLQRAHRRRQQQEHAAAAAAAQQRGRGREPRRWQQHGGRKHALQDNGSGDESEVESSAPVSEPLPTACSGVAPAEGADAADGGDGHGDTAAES